jgi:hypothetical protein
MGLSLLARLLTPLLIFSSPSLFGSAGNFLPRDKKSDTTVSVSKSYKKDTVVNTSSQILKICSCQIMDLQSSNHRQRNIALLAERSKSRNLNYDLSRISKVMGKEKKHLQYFFYDKLVVTNSFTERTDCRSLYLKLKRKNKFLILYDILDADIRH